MATSDVYALRFTHDRINTKPVDRKHYEWLMQRERLDALASIIEAAMVDSQAARISQTLERTE